MARVPLGLLSLLLCASGFSCRMVENDLDRAFLPAPREEGIKPAWMPGEHTAISSEAIRRYLTNHGSLSDENMLLSFLSDDAREVISKRLDRWGEPDCEQAFNRELEQARRRRDVEAVRFIEQLRDNLSLDWKGRLTEVRSRQAGIELEKNRVVVVLACRVTVALMQRSSPAAEAILDANIATDLVDMLNTPYGFAACAYPRSFAYTDQVFRLSHDPSAGFHFNTEGTNGFHFDDLFTFDRIRERWVLLRRWVEARAKIAQGEWAWRGKRDYLCVMGMTLHAVQDFYCHSNYALIFLQASNPPPVFDEVPIWEELTARDGTPGTSRTSLSLEPAWKKVLERFRESNRSLSTCRAEGGLQTGAWSLGEAEDPGTHEIRTPWKHRHPAGDTDEKALALDLASRASSLWLQILMKSLDAGHERDLLEELERP